MARFLELWVEVASTRMKEELGAGSSFSPAASNAGVCDTITFAAEFTGALQGRLIVSAQASVLELLKANPGRWPQLLERITAEAAAKLTSEHGLPVSYRSIPHPALVTSQGMAYTVEVGTRAVPLVIVDETRDMLVHRDAGE